MSCLLQQSYAQLHNYYDQKTSVQFFFYQSYLSTKGFGSSDGENLYERQVKSLGFRSAGFKIKSDNTGKGGRHSYWNYRLANDLWAFFMTDVLEVGSSLNDKTKRVGFLSSGLLGEFGFAWNLSSKTNHLQYLGFYTGDYYFYTNNQQDGQQGLFMAIGPRFGYDFELFNGLMLRLDASLAPAFAYYREKPHESNLNGLMYKKVTPLVFNFKPEVQTKSGFFFGMEIIKPLSGHRVQFFRTDILLGFHI